jgi:Ser/Thr protein kinase RdoA (MazF antagonist)
MKPAVVSQQFSVEGRLVTVTPTGSGNINDTYLAIYRTTFSEFQFILQRLNPRVFRSPETVMHNMRKVTQHVHRRLEAEAEEADRIWQLPRIIPTKDGRDFLFDEDGDCWRALSLIGSARAFDKVQGLEHAQEAGSVLGQFHRLTSDLPVEQLLDPLPGFHITPGYLAQLDEALHADEGRARVHSSDEARRCLRFVQERRDWCSVLEDAHAGGALPIRTIHGDPKVTNIMIDDITGKGTCIIDLDTVKPGLVQYDFGDCMRSCCNPAGEEVQDLSDVYFDTDLCAAIARGYMRCAGGFLTEADRQFLYDSIRLITFELGLRFFADYVAGDRYFKVKYDGQNLHRARVQFRLCESIETRESIIRKTLERCA